jgi:hypothetical protein
MYEQNLVTPNFLILAPAMLARVWQCGTEFALEYERTSSRTLPMSRLRHCEVIYVCLGKISMLRRMLQGMIWVVLCTQAGLWHGCTKAS